MTIVREIQTPDAGQVLVADWNRNTALTAAVANSFFIHSTCSTPPPICPAPNGQPTIRGRRFHHRHTQPRKRPCVLGDTAAKPNQRQKRKSTFLTPCSSRRYFGTLPDLKREQAEEHI